MTGDLPTDFMWELLCCLLLGQLRDSTRVLLQVSLVSLLCLFKDDATFKIIIRHIINRSLILDFNQINGNFKSHLIFRGT